MAAPLVTAPPARFRLYFSIYCLALALFLAVFVGEGLMLGAPVVLIATGPLGWLVLLVVRARQLAAFTDDGSLTVQNWFATPSFRPTSDQWLPTWRQLYRRGTERHPGTYR